MLLPPIGYGTFPSKEKLIQNIPVAHQVGYELIDTSDDYGNAEYIGRVKKCDENISKLTISTKISDVSHLWNFRNDFVKQKKLLGVPQNQPMDLLLLHFPYPHLYLDAWKELEKLYEEGLCKAIGVCNFEIHHLEKLLKYAKIKPMVNQFELHPLFRQKELCEYCERHNIAIMSYSPVARMDKRLINDEIIMRIAEKYQKSVVQVILRWDIQHRYIPIPAASKKEHIQSNIDVFDFSLTNEEMQQLDSLDCGMRIRFSPSTMWSTTKKIKNLIRHLQYKFKIY
ncbi:oxidoreductase, aldo/keto reductase family [Clostridium sp. D5]|nr:oxidoreductase, aldo/keto reductase family [Clostridium sp. D5]